MQLAGEGIGRRFVAVDPTARQHPEDVFDGALKENVTIVKAGTGDAQGEPPAVRGKVSICNPGSCATQRFPNEARVRSKDTAARPAELSRFQVPTPVVLRRSVMLDDA